jgi:ABC-2 type transport system ATP-binding protein
MQAITNDGTPTAATAADIELRGLRKRYSRRAGAVEAVRDVDLALTAGETVALLGPNGAGKSTTIDLLLGLQTPDAGTVTVFGAPPERAIADGRIGAMLQTSGLLQHLSVHELLTMVAALYPAPLDVEAALSLAQIEEIAAQRTERLSGGQAQRVRFALSLVGDPDLLILDEPTVGMDVEARHAFWTTVRGLAGRGRTILFATHYLEEAESYADRAVLMSRGRIVADGPTTQIKAMVGTRTIRATLPAAGLAQLERLPGVGTAERRGDAVVLRCTDADTAIRALLARYPQARDIEITAAGLEEAFLQLTVGTDDARQEAA